MHEELFVISKAMQLIEDGKVLRLVGIEGSRKNNAVRNVAGKNFAGDGIAFDTAGSERQRHAKEVENAREIKEVKEGVAGRSGEWRVMRGE
jgi:hypothetical protein